MMGCPTRIVLVLAVAATAACLSRAGDLDAATLAAQIDRHLENRLDTERVRSADRADDAEFCRRVYLDLHGTVPSADQASRFLADSTPAKREKLIDALLTSPRYGEFPGRRFWQGLPYHRSPMTSGCVRNGCASG